MTTLENVKYGWSENPGRSSSFWMMFSRCQSRPERWNQEIRNSAVHLANTAKKPIWVCFSGGIDSEVVCELFKELGIDFKVLTLAFQDGDNSHDTQYAREWCTKNKIEQKIVEFNLERFARCIPNMLAEGYIAEHFFRYYQIHLLELVEEMGGFAVLGGGEQLYELNGALPLPSNVALNFDVGFAASLEWCKRNNAKHEPYFYYSRPEVVLSWLRIPLVEFCLRNPDVLVHPQNKYVLKVMAMRTFFPQQKWRPKYNGFEKVEHIRYRVRDQLRILLGAKNQVYRIGTDELLEQLEPSNAATNFPEALQADRE